MTPPTRQVFRPSAAAYGRQIQAGVAVITILVFILIGGSILSGHLSSWLVTIAATLLVLAALTAAYLLNVRVVVTEREVQVSGLTGISHVWPRDVVKGCVVRDIAFPGIPRPQSLLIAYGADHRTLFRLRATYWSDPTLAQLHHALDPSHAFTRRLVKKRDIIKEFPGSLSFVDRHNWLVGGCLMPLAAFAIAVGLAPIIFR